MQMSEGPMVPAVRILCEQPNRQRKSHITKGLTAGPSGLKTYSGERTTGCTRGKVDIQMR